jgi:hypothetical protein
MKLNKKGMLLFSMEIVKWTFFIIFIALGSFLMMYAMSWHLDREIMTEDVELFLAKQYLIKSISDDGVFFDDYLKLSDKLSIRDNFGIGLNISGSLKSLNNAMYYEKPFCKFEQYECTKKPYSEIYLIDGELEEVKIDVVMKNE